MAPSKRKGTSVQTYRFSRQLAIRLEYDHADQRQSVFLNGELRSSFHCPVGFLAEHMFRGHDAISEERGHFGEWRVKFAAEQNTYRIRYELLRRNTDGDDTKWYWWDRNVESGDFTCFPAYDKGDKIEVECETCGYFLRCAGCNPEEFVRCEKCGEDLACPECDPPEDPNKCFECGGPLFCEVCEEREPRLVHDVARMQEEIQQIDANRLQDVLVYAIGSQVDSSTSWATVMEQVLTEAGYDISAVCLSLDSGGEESE